MQIGELTIQMAADLARLRSDMAEARQAVGGAMAGIESAVQSAQAALGALGIGLGIGAMMGMVRSAIDAADALDEMSQRIGISANELSSLQLAYKMAGLTSDDMASSLGKLQKQMADGNKAFDALGVKTHAADGSLRGTTDVLADLADEFEGLEGGAGKTALAMEIFGKSGASMVPLLDAGSQGLRDMIEQSERLGIVISNETAAAAGQFNDTLDLLGTGLQGIGQRLAAQMLPTLNTLSESFLTSMTSGDRLRGVADTLSAALKILYTVGVGVGTAFSIVGKTVGAAAAQIVAVLNGDFAGAKAIGAEWQADVTSSWTAAAAQISSAWNDTGGAAVAAMAKVQAAGKRMAPSVGKPGGAAASADPYAAEREAAKGWADAWSDFAKIAAEAQAKTNDLSKAQARLAEYLQSPAYSKASDGMRQLALEQAYAAIAAEKEAQARELGIKAVAEAIKGHQDLVKALTGTADSTLESAVKIEEENRATALATQLRISLAAAISLVEVARLREKQVEMMGNEDAVAAIEREIEARQRLRAAEGIKTTNADAEKRLTDYLSKDVGTNFAAGFDKASQSLGTFVQTFASLIDAQDKYNKARQDAGGDAAKLAQVEAKNFAQQINSYGSLAGAAKGMFKERTAGYKLMAGAEKAFRAVELAMAVQTAATQLGLIQGVTAAKVAGDLTGTASTLATVGPQVAAAATIGSANAAAATAAAAIAPPPFGFINMGLMAAAMAALGFAVSGGGGKGASAPTNSGTGTVLGDSSAQSESVTKAIEALAQVDTATMRYSAQMLQSLRNIESNIGGLASLLVQSGDLGSAAVGVQTGTQRNLLGEGVKGVTDVLTFGLLPGLGKALGNLFGSKTSVTGQGISANAQSLGSIQQRGFDASYYADVETKKKFLGVTTSTKNSTQLTDASAETERQFGLILSGFADTVKAAGGPLGVNLDQLQQRINGFTVDIGRIDLQGLTGGQISEKLTAVFSAAGDKIARGVLPGLDAFQAVGEGYLQTVARVATGVETAGAALDGLGVRAIGFQALTQKQGDVGQNIVRQSLVEAETQQVYRLTRGMFGLIRTTVESSVSGIGQIISSLDGSAQELADTYKALTDVRTSLQLLGINGQAVSFALLKGAGGLEGLTAGVAAFEESFFTDQEKVTAQTARMRKEFERLGVAMPATNDQFKALVQGTNTNTEAGQQLLGGLLGLSSGFADLTAAIEAAKEAGPASVVSEAMQAIMQQRAGLEQELADLVGGAEAVRRRELEAIDPSNRAIYVRVQALKDEQAAATAAAQQRTGLEQQLLQITGNTAALRARELAALAPSNRAMQQRIYELQDQQAAELLASKATADAAKAATDAADKARSLSEAWRSVGGSLQDEITRIQGLAGGEGTTTANAQAAFAMATAQARAGDQGAADRLSGLSKAMLDAAEQSAGSLRELAAIRAATVESLQQTRSVSAAYAGGYATQAGAIADNPMLTSPTLITSGASNPMSAPAPESPAAAAQNAVLYELQALREETQTLRKSLERMGAEQQINTSAIASNTGKSTRILERVTPNGDAFETRIASPI